MQFSERWLREWVDPDVDTGALCEQLTDAGLEVDGTSEAAPAFSGVVVGEVLEVAPHPNADKLVVCAVADGSGTNQVVCGAPNARAGMKSPLARPGAALPGVEVQSRELRGVESHGMLCSAAELGLGDDAEGILELPDTLVAGTDLREALGLDDCCITLDLTPNRGDCLSLKGVAREVGVLNDLPVRAPDCSPVPAETDDVFPVEIVAGDGCPRYLGRVMRDVDTGRQTPLWMTERLRRSGIRSIDPVVDVTNYVMLELGQPLHAFDLGMLHERIIVRMAEPDESFTLLDGSQVSLDEETLLIADTRGPVAMAGVMGGDRSSVQESTRDIFLECAFFAPGKAMGTARRYGMQTDASQRFERGVDHALQEAAIERATRLLLDIVGGCPGPTVVTESTAHVPEPAKVGLRRSRLDLLVGETVPESEVDRIFERLEFSPRKIAAGEQAGWEVTAPSHRFDIAIEEDLVEEICRVHGYNRVADSHPLAELSPRVIPRNLLGERPICDALVALGYRESITYSFVAPEVMRLLDPERSAVRISNPMSRDQSVMRTNLLPGLVGALQTNLARQQRRVRLFEYGQCFPSSRPEQVYRVGGIACGGRAPESWSAASDQVDFFDVKGDVERLLTLGGGACAFEPATDPVLHPGQSAVVLSGDQVIGRLGRLHPEIEESLDLGVQAFVFELDAYALLELRERRHRGISRFPSVRRDLAVVVDRSVSASAVESAVREVLGEALAEFTVFDLYEGESVDSNKKSLGIGLTFQHASRTLVDDETNAFIDAAVRCLAARFDARLR
ncbi:MAG: phenylalanine--tRNA ligase subunit beta [Gammaproteobacteria bacterium]|nr:phenylalanine--tRNA ligase subunit beta [Gammaproteobacteria bacterium]